MQKFFLRDLDKPLVSVVVHGKTVLMVTVTLWISTSVFGAQSADSDLDCLTCKVLVSAITNNPTLYRRKESSSQVSQPH